jgi:DNA-binding NtrC family response regulator
MPGPKILLVDDEPGLRMMLAANLELEGFQVVEADSGESALEMAPRERPDVVLTDIRMPGISGVELFRRLRELGLKMPVVLMTAFALEDLVQGALEDGAFTVLPKPFDVGHALRTVRRAARLPVVLVVDDIQNVAESTTESLRAAGLAAQAATSGTEAIEVLQAGAVDLCVLDLVMPGMSGAQLAEHVHLLDPGVSIIAVSGHDVPEMIRKLATIGMHTFLRKPVEMRELIRSIAIARGERRAGA